MKNKHIKRGAAGILVLLLLSILLPAVEAGAHNRHYGDEYIDIIVRYEETAPDEESLDPRFKNIHTMDVLPIQTMSVPASAIKELSLNENVKRITYDQEVDTSQSAYELSSDDWNQDIIGTFKAWEEGYTGEGVNVTVLDTGFHKHPEITYAGGHSIFGEEHELGADEWTNDHSGHGTHVAGILGAHQGTRAQGIAPDINLFGVKVYHEESGSKTNIGNLLSGLDWAIENDSDIIVISSGYSAHNQDIYEMIQEAYSQGTLTIAASGNKTEDNGTIDYPAAHEEVIAVSSVNNRLAHVSDSMVGPENELAAPGQNILSLSTDGTHTAMSGTSQATPHVAGIAALLMQKYPDDNAETIRKRMTDKALDLGDEGHDIIYGHGLVQYAEQADEDESPEEDAAEEPAEEETDSSEEPAANEDIAEDASGEDTEGPSEEAEEESSSSEEETEAEPTEEDSDTEQTEDESIQDTNEETDSSEASDAEENEETDTSEEELDEDTASEEESLPEQYSTVWIRPSETNGLATVSEEDIEAVPENGVLAVSFDASLGHIDRVSLSREQVAALKDKGITLLIARVDLEWVIPSENFTDGNAFITFESTSQPVAFKELTKGQVLTFGIEQEGTRASAFPRDMVYRFFTPAAEFNQDYLYEWNETEETWELLGDAYTSGGVVGVTSEMKTLAVFNPEELESARAAEENPPEDEEDLTETDVPEETDAEHEDAAEEDDSSFLNDDVSGLPVVLSSVVVLLLSVSGGFYFFGGKARS